MVCRASRQFYKPSLIEIPPTNWHSARCKRLPFGTHPHRNNLTRHPIAPPAAHPGPPPQARAPYYPQNLRLNTASTASTNISTGSYSKPVHRAHKRPSRRSTPPNLTTRPLGDTHHQPQHPQDSTLTPPLKPAYSDFLAGSREPQICLGSSSHSDI